MEPRAGSLAPPDEKEVNFLWDLSCLRSDRARPSKRTGSASTRARYAVAPFGVQLMGTTAGRDAPRRWNTTAAVTPASVLSHE